MIAGRKSAKPLHSFTERESELASDRYPLRIDRTATAAGVSLEDIFNIIN